MLIIRIAAIAAAVLALCAGFRAYALTAEETSALQRAADRGKLIYAYDQAASVATDELQLKNPTAADHYRGGWVVEDRGRTLHVVFYDISTGEPRAYFTADVDVGKVVSSHILTAADDGRLPPLDLRMINAVLIAVRLGQRPCGAAPFNTVALPPETPNGAIVVYLLTPQTTAGEYPAGGHYEVDVAADGSVLASRSFTRGCITLGGKPPTADSRPAAMFLTHLLDPTPTEIHVYLSFLSREPIFVGTQNPQRVWEVAGADIHLVQPK